MSKDHDTNNIAKLSVNLSPSPKLAATPETIIEEMACAIAEAQAALFAGRFFDLECCAGRLQKLCDSLKEAKHNLETHPFGGIQATTKSSAVRLQQQNKVFAAVLHRVRRHLEALRGLLNGPSLTYQPAPITPPERRN